MINQIGTLSSINEILIKHQREMKSLDITKEHEGAIYAIFRFLKSVIELSEVLKSSYFNLF